VVLEDFFSSDLWRSPNRIARLQIEKPGTRRQWSKPRFFSHKQVGNRRRRLNWPGLIQSNLDFTSNINISEVISNYCKRAVSDAARLRREVVSVVRLLAASPEKPMMFEIK
jgi:hypothetical protein